MAKKPAKLPHISNILAILLVTINENSDLLCYPPIVLLGSRKCGVLVIYVVISFVVEFLDFSMCGDCTMQEPANAKSHISVSVGIVELILTTCRSSLDYYSIILIN